MDLITGLATLAVAVLLGIVLYNIFVSSMEEKSYDELKAEQKKKAEEYLAQGRSAKEKAKDKKLKKAGKKVKEKTNSESIEMSSEEIDGVKSHVAFLEPPVVDEEPSVRDDSEIKVVEPVLPPQKQSSNKASKTQASQPKEPKDPKPEKVPAQKQTQQAVKPTNSSKPTEKPVNKPQPEKVQAQPKPVEEVATKASVKQVQSAAPAASSENASPSTKSSRKKRSELITLQQMSGERDAVNVNLLMPLVHKAELSRTEIQVLIDLLLNKQQGSSVDSAEWIEGRQDPVVKLKKQLAEKEKALAEEQEAAVALQSKLRELRSELNAEKHSLRQTEESLQARQAELGSVAGRMQLLAEEKQSMVQQIQQLQAKLSEEHMVLCKLQEDQGQVMQQELLAQRQQLELHIARLTEQHQETIAALEAQMGQMASQLQEQEAVNSGLSGELALIREKGAQSQDLARQVKELHSEIDRLMSKSQYDTGRLQSEISSLTEQLSLKRTESDKLSALVQSLQADNNCLTHQISSACVEAKQLRDENETLAAQVTASMERPATEGRENGDLTYTETKHLENSSSDKIHEKELLVETMKDEIISKEKEINRIKTDLAQQETLLNSLKGELDVAHTNAEKLLKEVSSYKCLVQEQESVINALREEGDSAHKLVNTLREDISKSKVELARLSTDCATLEQLESRESTIEKLTSELNTHKTKLADQSAMIQTLQREMLTQQLTYKTELAARDDLVETLTAQTNSAEADVKQLRRDLTASREAVDKLTREVKEYQEKQTSFSCQIETQKRKNDDLRLKNWKVMEALSTTEKTLETKVIQSQRLVNEAEERTRLEEQERTKQLLQRILPHVSVDSKQDYETWLEQFVSGAGARQSSDSDANMLAEVEQQNCQLQAMVTHYKAIIADTEQMLNRLQSHVEQEEGRWGLQIQTLESQLESVTQERDLLQENLESSAQLESALIKNKELSKELTRLQALVRIGEKSVIDQTKQTQQLQEQVDALQAGVKNGLSTVDVGSGTN